MKKQWNPIFSSVDVNLLLFLWKYRVATFQALKSIFYPTLSHRQAYDKIKRLKYGKYIVVEQLQGTHNQVWRLGKRGFSYIQNELMIDSKTKTFTPQSKRHDLFVMAALLGEWAFNPPANVKVVSEIELMETEVLEIPKELREMASHRPDGLWIFKSGDENYAVALEVEITRKTSNRYNDICAYYNRNLFFKNILWIVESKTHALTIQESAQRFGNTRPALHLFILLEDFKKLLWQSEFLNASQKGATIHSFLKQQLGVLSSAPLSRVSQASLEPLYGRKNLKISPLLDFELSLSKSVSYETSDIPKKL